MMAKNGYTVYIWFFTLCSFQSIFFQKKQQKQNQTLNEDIILINCYTFSFNFIKQIIIFCFSLSLSLV